MQNWEKLGVVHNSKGLLEWQMTHAMMPCVFDKGEYVEVYFSPRDNLNRSRPAKIDLYINGKTFRIEKLSQKPLLELGELGMYDDSGVMPTCVISKGNKVIMYYNGWTLGKLIPFTSFNGIAESNDGGKTFKKLSLAPKALYRSDVDPYSTFAPYVLKHNGLWHMWYVSLTRWEMKNKNATHYYHIKYAISTDGIDWSRKGQVAVDFKSEFEYAIARPCVLFEDNIFKMWYSYRASEKSKTYRIGYAESSEGIKWVRRDEEVNLTISRDGWDNQMVCYSYVFKHKNKKYMLYNGNDYGKTGIGIAILN